MSRDTYTGFHDLHDMLGLRVITYFPEDVDGVARIVERLFEVDRARSSDKRALIDPDRFGYVSLHYVASISPERASLPEFASHASTAFEIQIRSILQHAWAEIEHDLGYKSPAAIPRDIRRRFSRLAGLLELADTEFGAIRNDLDRYIAALPTAISESADQLGIDKDSLLEFISKGDLISQLDQQLANVLGGTISGTASGWSSALAAEMQFWGLMTIADLEEKLEQSRTRLVEFADALIQTREWAIRRKQRLKQDPIKLTHDDGGDLDDDYIDRDHPDADQTFFPGISIFYLAYLLAGESGSVTRTEAYLDEFSIGHPDSSTEVFARLIQTVYMDTFRPS